MFGDVLKQLRKARGLTQSRFAELMNVAQATVASWENGTRKPDIETISQIADVLEVSTDYLLGRKVPQADDLMELREKIRRDPDLGELFSAATTANPEHVRAAAAMLRALKETTDAD